jgi:hypothetical protein
MDNLFFLKKKEADDYRRDPAENGCCIVLAYDIDSTRFSQKPLKWLTTGLSKQGFFFYL